MRLRNQQLLKDAEARRNTEVGNCGNENAPKIDRPSDFMRAAIETMAELMEPPQQQRPCKVGSSRGPRPAPTAPSRSAPPDCEPVGEQAAYVKDLVAHLRRQRRGECTSAELQWAVPDGDRVLKINELEEVVLGQPHLLELVRRRQGDTIRLLSMDESHKPLLLTDGNDDDATDAVDIDDGATDATGLSRATSVFTIMMSKHCEERMEERDIVKKALQAAVKHGVVRPSTHAGYDGAPRVICEYNGICFVTDAETKTIAITCYPRSAAKTAEAKRLVEASEAVLEAEAAQAALGGCRKAKEGDAATQALEALENAKEAATVQERAVIAPIVARLQAVMRGWHVRRHLPEIVAGSPASSRHIRCITLVKPEANARLGIVLIGKPHSPPTVKCLSEGGLAALDGTLQPGVTLLAVNGARVRDHEQATELLKAAVGTLQLDVLTVPARRR